jgi:hypothetical protein
MELTRQMEKFKLARVGANTGWLFLAGTAVEVIVGIAFVGQAIRMFILSAAEPGLSWTGYAMLLVGLTPIAHAAYLSFNRFLGRRMRLLYEAVLAVPDK